MDKRIYIAFLFSISSCLSIELICTEDVVAENKANNKIKTIEFSTGRKSVSGVVPGSLVLNTSSTDIQMPEKPLRGIVLVSNSNNGNSGSVYIYPLPRVASGNQLFIQPNGEITRSASSIESKDNITPLAGADVVDILSLGLYKYNYIGSNPDFPQYGVIGEYMVDQGLFPNAIFYEIDGTTVAGVDYQTLFIAAVYELQKLKREFNQLLTVLQTNNGISSGDAADIEAA